MCIRRTEENHEKPPVHLPKCKPSPSKIQVWHFTIVPFCSLTEVPQLTASFLQHTTKFCSVNSLLAQYSQGSLCNGTAFASIGKWDRSWNTWSISNLLPGFAMKLVLLSTADTAQSECGAAEISSCTSDPGNRCCSENFALTCKTYYSFTLQDQIMQDGWWMDIYSWLRCTGCM
jgi:hypothetical protein